MKSPQQCLVIRFVTASYLRCSFCSHFISHNFLHLYVITISFIILAAAAFAAITLAAAAAAASAAAFGGAAAIVVVGVVDFGYLRSTCQYNAHVIKNIISSILICALFWSVIFRSKYIYKILYMHTNTWACIEERTQNTNEPTDTHRCVYLIWDADEMYEGA